MVGYEIPMAGDITASSGSLSSDLEAKIDFKFMVLQPDRTKQTPSGSLLIPYGRGAFQDRSQTNRSPFSAA